MTKDDLWQFLSIKPHLSARAQGLVEMLSEIHHSGGQLDMQSLSRIMGAMGANLPNMSALTSLAGLSGKLDPAALLGMLGSTQQANREPSE